MDEDPIKVWQDPHSHPLIPHNIIMCPLGQEDLEHEHYSLSHQGVPSYYFNQEKLLKETSSNKPLTTLPMMTPQGRGPSTSPSPFGPSLLTM